MEPVLVHRHPCRITVMTAKNERGKKINKISVSIISSVSSVSKNNSWRLVLVEVHRSQVRGIKRSLFAVSGSQKLTCAVTSEGQIWRKIPSPEEGRVSRLMQVGD